MSSPFFGRSRNALQTKVDDFYLPISLKYANWNVEIIAKGTFGLVRLATSKYGEKVAIKTVQKERATSSSSAISEHDILKQLGQHKNVVELLGCNILQEGTIVELCLEYIPYDIFVLNPYLNFRHARHFFRQLIEGIEFIHSKRIAHRDIKVENLLLTKDFLLKIADFGFATNSYKNGIPRKMAGFTGTKCYMPPEMYLGPYLLHPVDIFACGIVLIEMVNGKPPWDEPFERDLKFRMWENGSIKHSTEWEDMPDDVIPLLKWILHPDPKKRATTKEIRADPWYQHGCASVEEWTGLRKALRTIDAEERKNRKKGKFRGHELDRPLEKERVDREKSYKPYNERVFREMNNENRPPKAPVHSPRPHHVHAPLIEKQTVQSRSSAPREGGGGCSLM